MRPDSPSAISTQPVGPVTTSSSVEFRVTRTASASDPLFTTTRLEGARNPGGQGERVKGSMLNATRCPTSMVTGSVWMTLASCVVRTVAEKVHTSPDVGR